MVTKCLVTVTGISYRLILVQKSPIIAKRLYSHLIVALKIISNKIRTDNTNVVK